MSQTLLQVSECRISRFFDRGEGKDRQVIAVIEMWGKSFQVPLLDPNHKNLFPQMKIGVAFIDCNLDECKREWFDKETKTSRQYSASGFFPLFLNDFKPLK